jgi:tetratricopeptide (TPR) repeat protein
MGSRKLIEFRIVVAHNRFLPRHFDRQEKAMKALRSERHFHARRACAVAFAVLVLPSGLVRLAQAGETQPADERIAVEISQIRDAEQKAHDSLEIGRMWAKLASDYEDQSEFVKSEEAYNRALRLLEPSSSQQVDYAVVLENLGSLYDMMGNFAASERCVVRSLAARVKLGDPLYIALGEEHLANVHRAMHKYKESRHEALEAYQEMTALKDSGTDNLVSALFTLSYVTCTRGGCNGSLEYARKAWSLVAGAFPLDSPQAGLAHMALGYATWRAGMKDVPDAEMREGMKILKMRLPTGHPYVISALEQYREYLAASHREAEAEEIAQEKAQLQGARNCANCTVSVQGLR